ncbi:hypothetical protein FYJ51_11400 [Erysipelotrichaceae bacterium Oil+RF-744-GAM-WT-6]|jgi:hypothetical protein|uniref:Uncharacterized protein n=1 Tax=Stecheria intestinalis TaxID=2606630 RepID=A0A7X2NU35_9FIRM|nr:hypothetical protein [Stecheria intestinalis]MCI2153957.1 hypothetical protein [Solobacterium sp.]MDD7681058.1 hypothetical protein [Stecheria intestinalis]MDY4682403.1 hypothetical protein [Lachnospiraceae bacterium]MSS59497.1 hypothetical protein [Stecheria intestinalis]
MKHCRKALPIRIAAGFFAMGISLPGVLAVQAEEIPASFAAALMVSEELQTGGLSELTLWGTLIFVVSGIVAGISLSHNFRDRN